MITVNISDRSGKRLSFFAEQGQRLLQAGLAAGLGLPHECATGTCGNCKAAIVNGDVVRLWPNAPGAKLCRNENEVLLCQSAAAGPVDLALRGNFMQPCEPPCTSLDGEITHAHSLTPEIAIFSVKLREPFAYEPGQFVLLSGLSVDGPRAYSMMRHEPEKAELTFLIRKDSKGSFSKMLFDGVSGVRPVSVFGPLGRAIFSHTEDRPFFMIAGGSGIAGMLAILHHALVAGHFENHTSHLFFGLRDAASSYLLDELAAMVERSNGKLSATIAFSDAPCPPEFAAQFPSLRFEQGFVHDVARQIVTRENKVTAIGKSLFFVAGPPVMVDATMRMLVTECKISPAEIRYDRYG